MRKETDLSAVKQVAMGMVYLPIKETVFSPAIVIHPIFESGLTFVQIGKYWKEINLLEDSDALKETRKEMEEKIAEMDNLFFVYHIIRAPYKLTFIKHVLPYLSQYDLSLLLADAWVNTENPNGDINCSLRTIKSWFKKCQKNVLMCREDFEIYNTLPDEFELYRGVAVGRNPKGLSWTRNLKRAEWFANRFNSEDEVGCILKATVRKEDVLAYFNIRNEEEVVVDSSKLEINLYKSVYCDEINGVCDTNGQCQGCPAIPQSNIIECDPPEKIKTPILDRMLEIQEER